jgi:hypothetical protein
MYPVIYPSLCPYSQPVIYQFIHTPICSSVHPFIFHVCIYQAIHPFSYSTIRWHIHLADHPSVLPSVDKLAYPLSYPNSRPLTCQCVLLSVDPCIISFIHPSTDLRNNDSIFSIVTNYVIGDRGIGVRFPPEAKHLHICLVQKKPDQTGAHSVPYSTGTGLSCLVLRLSRLQMDHLSLSGTDAKNECSFTSTIPCVLGHMGSEKFVN